MARPTNIRLLAAVWLLLLAGPAFGEPEPLARETRGHYLTIILEGSMNVSKTVVKGVNLGETPPGKARRLSEANFKRTARWMLANAHQLELSPATALEINRRLREGMADDSVFRQDERPSRDDIKGRAKPAPPISELPNWQRVLSARALRAGRRDPVALAESIHTETQGFREEFFDANGRTARLMADLALIKNGRAPVLYPPQQTYFMTASPLMFGWSQRDRIQREFPRMVANGQKRFAELTGQRAAAPARAKPKTRARVKKAPALAKKPPARARR